MRTLIRNGLVITAAEESTADVLVEDEKVVALAATGSTVAESWTADTIVDATGSSSYRRRRRAHAHRDGRRRDELVRHVASGHPRRGVAARRR